VKSLRAHHLGRKPRLVLWLLAGILAAGSPSVLLGQSAPPSGAGRLTREGVVRAQAVVDSVFLDRKSTVGTIEGGDWASYLLVRLGVNPFPDSTEFLVAVDSSHITFSGRIRDLPPDARAMIGPLSALVDSNTVLVADIVQLPANKGLAHFRLRGVSVGGFSVPDLVLHSMLLDIGERYPALTESGRDLYIEIPPDGRVTLVQGGVRLSAPPPSPGGPRGKDGKP
jgi:hypothetical protein